MHLFFARPVMQTAVQAGFGVGAFEDAARKLRASGLDVFVREPLPLDHPYLQMKHPERLSLAPHVAWASREARTRLVSMIADNIAKGW